MIMNKFQKRISKMSKSCQAAIVVGSAFGHLEELLEIFGTVFVVDDQPPAIRAKNLVYRESFEMFEQMSEVNFMFYDLNTIGLLDKSPGIWNRNRPIVIIEGRDVIGRDFSKALYDNRYNAVHQEEEYHVWKLNQ
jgi:hypothetical protein